MPRLSKITKRVFADVIKPDNHRASYDEFLKIDEKMGLYESEFLKEMKGRYFTLVREHVDDIETLAAMEEIIIQIRAKEVIDSELRLSLSRNYIYARSLFYRRNTKINDIRVIIGKVEDHGDDLNQLINDSAFRDLCKQKLLEAMNNEIRLNRVCLKFKYDEKSSI